MFALQREESFKNGNGLFIFNQPSLQMINASSAIWLLARQLKPRRVWLPTYLCQSIIKAIETNKSEIAFYPIDNSLNLLSTSWMEDLDQTDLIIFIDYFGFPFDPDVVKQMQKKGIKVVRDASQALLSKSATKTDFTVYSPRKFFGVPDGGILTSGEQGLGNVGRLNPPPKDWWLRSVHSGKLRRRFDLEGGENLWFPVFREVESNAPIGPYRMSDLSERLLRCCVDVNVTCQRRRENYHYLASHLRHIAIFPDLPDTVVPLGFPVCVQDRDKVRRHLIENNIFPPVHWELEGVVPKTYIQSHNLSKSIMTLPCDQRYETKHMQRIVEHIQSARRA